ncbi:Dehydrogenase/reductase SDR family member 2; mitochondrial, partial [Camelus dromedarius]
HGLVVAVLQADGLSVTSTLCHVGKAEDQERLVATVRAHQMGVSQFHLFLTLCAASVCPPALESCGGINLLVGSAAVSPQEGSSLGTSEQAGDKVRPREQGAVRFSWFLTSTHTPGWQGSQRTVGTLSFLCPPVAIYSTGENMVVAG